MRNAIVFTLSVALTLGGAVGCATLKLLGPDTVNCAKQSEPQLLASMPQVAVALAQENFVAALDALGGDLGDIVTCDLAALAAQQADAGQAQPQSAKASAYLQAKGLAGKVVNAPTLK
jgi:hypothetical protein